MAANKFMDELRKLEGAVKENYDYFAETNLLKFSSPSLNWLFGKHHGMPKGLSALFWGSQKAGKSLLLYDLIGQLHQTDPEALAIKFDTEYRAQAQLTPEKAEMFGIDMDRYQPFETNRPEDIFDALGPKGKITGMLQRGAKIGLIGIDSLSEIMGQREEEQDTMTKQFIGDQAITVQKGLRAIRHTIRTHKIPVIATAHARDEMDPIKVMRGQKKKPAIANAGLHFFEFLINISKNETKDGRKDALDREFVDESRKNMVDKGEQTGHKVRVHMQDSTVGAKGRVAEITLNYNRGIVNQHEEVFQLGLNWGVIGRPSKGTYIIGENKFNGKPACLEALSNSPELQQIVMNGILELEKVDNFINTASLDSSELED